MDAMSQPDDLDRLLRELDAMNTPTAAGSSAGSAAGSAAGTPARRASGDVATGAKGRKGTAGGRMAWTGVGAVGAGVVGGLAGVLPFVTSFSAAVGAAVGGAAIAFMSGPPRWFDDGQ
jgi:hypothetical protein